ncbi:MAG: hypothetical protein EU521_01910 [Promethearchaeota archaeon]|nr:MAG: hypothetical protein EU521_01910 [Candidatus Lokiarchaeota archaeon]
MKIYIAFDTAHKERGKIDENYTELKEFLNSNGFSCKNFVEASITHESLKPYDILVFACPDFAKISRQEILEIENWVKDDGGGILLLSHAGGDRGRNSNLSDVSELFGITFENDQVLDEEKNFGFENLPIVSEFNPPHPITNDIEKICYRAGCSLTIIGAAIPIVSSNETSDPFSTPLICVSEPERGRVVCSGSYEMFRDQIGGGFQFEEHPKFASNLFNWLLSEYRTDLRSSGKLPTPEPERADLEEFCESEEIKTSRFPRIDIKEDITNRDEILDLLNSYLNYIEIMRENIKKIIKNIPEGKEKEIVEDEVNKFLITDADFEELKKKQKQLSKSTKKEKSESDVIISKKEDTNKSEVEEETSKSEEGEEEQPEKEEFEDIDLDARREELEAEVESLESKLKSIVNLLKFVESKYEKGDMDEENFKKQRKKFQKDLEKIKGRIKKLSKILKE